MSEEQSNTSAYYCQKCYSLRDANGYCTATNDPNCKYKYIAMPVGE